MHAERNRRYRDRRRCVTDHGLSGAQGERFVPPVNTASTDRPSQRNRTWTGALPSLPPIGVGVSAPLIPMSSSRRPPISPSTLTTGHTARPATYSIDGKRKPETPPSSQTPRRHL
jgi:hypothetical protein